MHRLSNAGGLPHGLTMTTAAGTGFDGMAAGSGEEQQ